MLTKDLATVKRDREKAVKARDQQIAALEAEKQQLQVSPPPPAPPSPAQALVVRVRGADASGEKERERWSAPQRWSSIQIEVVTNSVSGGRLRMRGVYSRW